MVTKRFRNIKLPISKTSILGVIFGLSGLILVGRLFGFFREILVAAKFGVSSAADAAVVILTLPDFMVGIFLVGGFNAALTPALKRVDPKLRINLVFKSFFLFGGLFTFFGILISAFPNIFLLLIAPALQNYFETEFLLSLRLSLVALPMVALVGIAGSYLASLGSFLIPPLSVILYNIILIIYLYYFSDFRSPIIGLSIVVVVASTIRLMLHLIAMHRLNFRRSLADWKKVQFPPKFLPQFFFGVAGYSVIILAPIIFRSFYSTGGDGYLALFNFSLKLFEFAAGILIAPIILVLIPKFSSKKLDDKNILDQVLRRALFSTLTIGVLGSVIGLTFIPFFSEIIFLRGEMTNFGVDKITYITSIILLSFPFFAVAQVCMARLNARGLALKSFKWSILSLFLSMSLTTTFFEAFGLFKEEIAAIGYAMFHFFLAVFLLFQVRVTNFLNIKSVKEILYIMLRTVFGIAPFLFLILVLEDNLNVWVGAGLSLPAGLILLVLNFKYIKPLFDMQIDRT